MTTSPSTPPDKVEETVQSLADLHDEHLNDIGWIQTLANRLTAALGRPATVVALGLAVILWMVGNAVALLIWGRTVDRFPYPDLEFVATVFAFLVTMLILTTQRHEQEVELKRDQLTLHMAVLSEKKIAKVIALLEEQRRDNPLLGERADDEAEAMAKPADPRDSLSRIENTSLTN